MEQDITSSPILTTNNYINPQLAENQIVNDDSPVKSKIHHHRLRNYIFGIGIVIFMISYLLVWTKVFGLF